MARASEGNEQLLCSFCGKSQRQVKKLIAQMVEKHGRIDAAVLAGAGRFDHCVLHVVRDPRAVVHSWRRAKTFTAAGKTMTMGTRSLASTVRRWTASSLAAEALRHRLPASRWMHLRYEDFARRPLPSIEAILTFMGENGPTTFADDHTVMLSPNHIVAGDSVHSSAKRAAATPHPNSASASSCRRCAARLPTTPQSQPCSSAVSCARQRMWPSSSAAAAGSREASRTMASVTSSLVRERSAVILSSR